MTLSNRIICAAVLGLLVAARGQAAAPSPALIISEAASNVVTVTAVSDAKVTIGLTIVNRTTFDIAEVRAVVTDFVPATGPMVRQKPESVVIEGAQADGTFAMPKASKKTITITVQLPAALEYRSHVALSYLLPDQNKTPETVESDIKVTRSAAAQPTVAIDETIAAVQAVIPFLHSGSTEPVSVSIRETAGASVTVKPKLQSFLYKPKADVSFNTPAKLDASPVTVGPKGTADVQLRITGVRSAGPYAATVRFLTDNAAPIDRTFNVYARQSWAVAAAFILAGVLVALALRTLATVVGPRLALTNRATVLFQQLHEAAIDAKDDPVATAVVEGLRQSLSQAWDPLARSGRVVGTTVLDLFEAKLPLLRSWIRLRRAIAPDLPAAVRKPADDALAAAQTVLENPATTAAAIEEQRGKLADVPAALAKAAAEELKKAIDAARTELQGADPEIVDLRTRLGDVSAKLDPKNATSVKDAFAAVDALRRQYTAHLGRRLRAEIKPNAPFGIDPAEWTAITSETESLLARINTAKNADAAADAYQSALQAFVRPVATALSVELATKIAANTPSKAQYEALKTRVDTLLTDMAAGKLADVAARLHDIIRDYGQVQTAAGSPMGGAVAAAVSAVATAPSMAASALMTLFGFAPLAAELSQPGAVRAVRSRAQWTGIASLLLVILLAVGLGVKTLWAADWTWGSPRDYLIAFLWGAGLSAFTYDGIATLMDRWSS